MPKADFPHGFLSVLAGTWQKATFVTMPPPHFLKYRQNNSCVSSFQEPPRTSSLTTIPDLPTPIPIKGSAYTAVFLALTFSSYQFSKTASGN